jgi:hypothetical protein
MQDSGTQMRVNGSCNGMCNWTPQLVQAKGELVFSSNSLYLNYRRLSIPVAFYGLRAAAQVHLLEGVQDRRAPPSSQNIHTSRHLISDPCILSSECQYISVYLDGVSFMDGGFNASCRSDGIGAVYQCELANHDTSHHSLIEADGFDRNRVSLHGNWSTGDGVMYASLCRSISM